MSFGELLPYLITLVTIVAAVLIVLYATRSKEKKVGEPLQPSQKLRATERWRFRVQKSISLNDAKKATDELRTLGLEREILSDAIRRLYEAHAEGKITEEERELLAKRYKSRMMTIKDAIAESESLVALHELEAMQEDLINLFDERFDELNIKIETLRSQVGIEAKEALIPATLPLPQIEVEPPEKIPAKKAGKKSTRRPPQKSRKTAAEERIEKIKAEVEKVLDRLEQMEVEA
ncbi:MAG: hypothetical protein JSV05_01945 [Candidatus Bathyarchaeota archaeon]|nr:MAG: hypothetical protein JSV05_01945 [Candidatus Bathyarchaeota archaeon]